MLWFHVTLGQFCIELLLGGFSVTQTLTGENWVKIRPPNQSHTLPTQITRNLKTANYNVITHLRWYFLHHSLYYNQF